VEVGVMSSGSIKVGVMSSGSIAGLNGSGVHDQSAIPPPTRANVKAKTASNATNKNKQTKEKQTQSSRHNCKVCKRTNKQELSKEMRHNLQNAESSSRKHEKENSGRKNITEPTKAKSPSPTTCLLSLNLPPHHHSHL
jgi:hypothetical protein